MTGLVFLAIVIVSPDGLLGMWDRLWAPIRPPGTGVLDEEPALAVSQANQ